MGKDKDKKKVKNKGVKNETKTGGKVKDTAAKAAAPVTPQVEAAPQSPAQPRLSAREQARADVVSEIDSTFEGISEGFKDAKAVAGALFNKAAEGVKKHPTIAAAGAGFLVAGPFGALVAAAATTDTAKAVATNAFEQAASGARDAVIGRIVPAAIFPRTEVTDRAKSLIGALFKK